MREDKARKGGEERSSCRYNGLEEEDAGSLECGWFSDARKRKTGDNVVRNKGLLGDATWLREGQEKFFLTISTVKLVLGCVCCTRRSVLFDDCSNI